MSRGPGRPHTYTYSQTTQGPGLRGLRTQAHALSAGFPCGQKHAAGQGWATWSTEEQQTGTELACDPVSAQMDLYVERETGSSDIVTGDLILRVFI